MIALHIFSRYGDPCPADAEYGHVLSEPGDEQMWLDGLRAEERAYMQGVGK